MLTSSATIWLAHGFGCLCLLGVLREFLHFFSAPRRLCGENLFNSVPEVSVRCANTSDLRKSR